MPAIPAPIPDNDPERVDALHALQILDTLPEQGYDDLVLLAAQICDTPIALVSLVDTDRQWFKAKLGLTASETPRDMAFCGYAILQPETVLCVDNALNDPRFATHEAVTGELGLRTYAGAPIVMESGAVLGTLCVIDTAPRKLTADQISALQALARQVASQLETRRVNLHLESIVAERTHDLQTALEAAEAASRAKSEFVSAMSHEVRTPMNGVIGMIDVLEQTTLESAQKEIVAMAKESAHSLLRIVDDILDFSKIEAGSFQINRDAISLERVTMQACESLKHLAVAKGVALSARVDPGLPPWVIGDGLRVGQVLLNLIGNAIKFSSGEGRNGIVEVHARLVEHDGRGHGVEVDVTDNGFGMDADSQSRLFTPFTQGDAGTTKRFGGTGLGLSISARLASLMGGRIAVRSVYGEGSCFTFCLPVELAEPASAEPNAWATGTHLAAAGVVAKPGSPPASASRPGRNERVVLVAEDNEMNQLVISKQLATLGFVVDMAASGEVALDKFAGGEYALLLTDLHMPAMDGFELARRIRAVEPAGTRLPIVALSADVSVGVTTRCREAGMDDCANKPLPLVMFRALLDKWLPDPAQPVSSAASGVPLQQAGVTG